MEKEQISALIEKAKKCAENSFVPQTGEGVGACALTEKNIIFGGCAIENIVPSASVGAGAVAVLKAVSEGETSIKAVAIFKFGNGLPYISGTEREIINQFGKSALIILASETKEETCRLYELLPYAMSEE